MAKYFNLSIHEIAMDLIACNCLNILACSNQIFAFINFCCAPEINVIHCRKHHVISLSRLLDRDTCGCWLLGFMNVNFETKSKVNLPAFQLALKVFVMAISHTHEIWQILLWCFLKVELYSRQTPVRREIGLDAKNDRF